MDWIPLLGAVGFGAIATKLLDVLWLQRVLFESERRKWLREQRYRAYSELAREVMSTGPFLQIAQQQRFLALIADALLVTTDKRLIERLRNYCPEAAAAARRLDQFINNGTSTIEERESFRLREVEAMEKRASELMSSLREAL